MSNLNRLKNHHDSEYGSVYSSQGLSDARHHLAVAKAHEPVDSIDAKLKGDQIEMLESVIQKREEGIAALSEREREAEERGVQQIAEGEAAMKQDVMRRLRAAFPGSDSDFERVAEDLYDQHLKEQTLIRMQGQRPNAYRM